MEVKEELFKNLGGTPQEIYDKLADAVGEETAWSLLGEAIDYCRREGTLNPAESEELVAEQKTPFHVTVNREAFIDTLAGLPYEKKTALPILSCIVIEGIAGSYFGSLQLWGTDLELFGKVLFPKCDVHSGGSVCVSYTKLIGVLKNLDVEEVELKQEGDSLVVRWEEGEYKIPTVSISDFPAFPNPAVIRKKKLEIPVPVFIEGVKSVAYAVAKDDSRLSLQTVHIRVIGDELHFVGSDGHRLVLKKYRDLQGLEDGFSVNLPPKSTRYIEKMAEGGTVIVEQALNFIKIGATTGTLWIREVEGEYPDYLSVIPTSFECEAEVSVSKLSNVLKRIISFMSVNLGVKFSVSQSQGTLRIFFEDQEEGSGEERVEVVSAHGEMEVGFNPKYLLDFLKGTKAETVRVKFTSPDTAAVLESGEATYVVMPMRI